MFSTTVLNRKAKEWSLASVALAEAIAGSYDELIETSLPGRPLRDGFLTLMMIGRFVKKVSKAVKFSKGGSMKAWFQSILVGAGCVSVIAAEAMGKSFSLLMGKAH